MSEKFYVCTAIEYVNATPHVGHSHEKIGADVIARAMRMRGRDVIFQMGTDEHSTNVVRAAKEQGLDPLTYCNQIVKEFIRIWEKINLSYDVFIRTTEQRHKDTVADFLQRIHDNGDIYAGKYEGYYCSSCEHFYQEKDLEKSDGKLTCPTHNIECEWLEEDNYFFRLSKYRDPLLKKIEENPDFIRPEIRRNEILNVLKQGLDDISISRSGVEWGVPLPWDEEAVTYVWFDALINYISAVGYSDDRDTFRQFWPATLQIIGKDITRFHCIYWPAMLMSAGIELPETIFGHGFVHFSGEKMSKTTGAIVDPVEVVDKYGADSLRWYLTREIHWGKDGNFSWERFIEVYNSDLANNLGNLVNRSLIMIGKYADSGIEIPDDAAQDRGETFDPDVLERYIQSLDNWKLHEMADIVIEMVDGVNRYIDRKQPWALARQEDKQEELKRVLFILAESLRWIATCVRPIMPEAAATIWDQLNLPSSIEDVRFDDLQWGGFPAGVKVNKPTQIFPRIEI